MKRLRPAFVITSVVLAACSSDHTHANPPPPSSETASATATASDLPTATATVEPTASATAPVTASASASAVAEPPKTRQRVGKTDVKKEWAAAKPIKGKIKSLHPQDAEGRTIFVNDENFCFVESPKKAAKPSLTEGTDAGPEMEKVYVDCPEIFDDPAWDERRTGWSLVQDETTKQCMFTPKGVTPPPPNQAAKCPAAPKKKPDAKAEPKKPEPAKSAAPKPEPPKTEPPKSK